APCAWQAFAIPQAIERLLATPRIRPRLPRKRFEASGMILLAAAPTAGHLWHRGQGPTSSRHWPRSDAQAVEYRRGTCARSGDMVLARGRAARDRDVRPMVRTVDTRPPGKETRIGRIPAGHRGCGSGTSTLRASAHPQRRVG